jgi:hypothetical protein
MSTKLVEKTDQAAPPPSFFENPKSYGIAIAIIAGLGCVLGAIGVLGYVDIIRDISQIDAMIIMGTAGGTIVLTAIAGIATILKINRNSERLTEDSNALPVHQTKSVQQSELIAKPNPNRFGKKEWETYLGKIGEEPPLPENIEEILNSPCPFYKPSGLSGWFNTPPKVKDTHVLVLIPETVNGKPLSLNHLNDCIPNPETKFCALEDWSKVQEEIGEILDSNVAKSYWVLVSKEAFTRSSVPDQMDKSIKNYKDYEIPKAIEVVTCILAALFTTQTQLFKNFGNFTHCCDPFKYRICVGFLPKDSIYYRHGIFLSHMEFDENKNGCVAVRRFT